MSGDDEDGCISKLQRNIKNNVLNICQISGQKRTRIKKYFHRWIQCDLRFPFKQKLVQLKLINFETVIKLNRNVHFG